MPLREFAKLFVLATAVALPLAAGAKSTKIDVKKPFFRVSVGADGTVSGDGGKISVSHKDSSWRCQKIKHVIVVFSAPGKQTVGGDFLLKDALCNFDNVVPIFKSDPSRQASYTLPFDGAWDASGSSAVKAFYVNECKKLSSTGKNGGKTTTRHPNAAQAEITLWARASGLADAFRSAGRNYEERQVVSDLPVELTCAPCEKPSITQPAVNIFADQMANIDATKLASARPGIERAELVNLPTGMYMNGHIATGRPAAGTYTSRLRVWSTCKSGNNTAEFPVSIRVNPAGGAVKPASVKK
jgi:hypothetical protein